MTEPEVTLTDYAVALETVLFLALIWRGEGRDARLRTWFTLLFASVGAASLFGGTVHGFLLDQQAAGHEIFWTATLLAMGLTAFSMWAIGAQLLFSTRVVRWVLAAAGAQFLVYAAATLFGSRPFWVGLVDNLPALVFLFIAFGLIALRQRSWQTWLATGGPVLVLIAAALQQLRIGLHAVYFNHNVLYHVLQGIALLMLFLGGRHLVGTNRSAARAVEPIPYRETARTDSTGT